LISLAFPDKGRRAAYVTVKPSSTSFGMVTRQKHPCLQVRASQASWAGNKGEESMGGDRNVLGEPLEPCCLRPTTGFFRTGSCETGPEDVGAHTVCVQVTAEFLDFSRQRGNDLSTPAPAFGFPGLKPGDRWCLCASRWKEALCTGPQK
jgi:uncharacterized protein (DUF2237 family)